VIGATAASATLAPALIKCRVSVKAASGLQTYDGLFCSTFAAVVDAQTRIGSHACGISARALA